MHIILGLLALAGAAYFWIIRARNAAEMTHELADVANDVRLAARRFGFRRRHNRHPADDIDDPKVAIGGLAVSFLELDALPTSEQRSALDIALQRALNIDRTEAEELTVLGRWLMNECGGASAAMSRLSRKLQKLGGAETLEPLMEVIKAIAAASEQGLSTNQSEALDDIKRAFRIR